MTTLHAAEELGEPADQDGAWSLRYRPKPGVFDEMVASDGLVKPAWREVARYFAGLDPSTISGLAQRLQRLTDNTFSDPARGGSAWQVDLVPLMIDKSNWSILERAAHQRARLYDALLADLYGAQTLFANGVLPPELVFNDHSFLRPVHGVTPGAGHLTFLALDFARDETGAWRIIDAHAETPAGHGFVLGNRMVVAEVTGALFRRTKARRIGDFYQRLGDDILRRTQSDQPIVAMLATSPTHSAFVGNAFMARYMSHVRVHGSDIRIVGQVPYLKTINGLQKIDLLIRAVDGHRADPLELDPAGFEGPVGLVSACRHNPDLMINALGSATIENRGLSGYLQPVATALLGEQVEIFDSPRLWLGDAVARQHVLANLDDYVILETQEGTGRPGQAAQGRNSKDMTPAERRALEAEIQVRASFLVAEMPKGFSTAPRWSEAGIVPASFAVRVFVAKIGGAFTVMPGGLALNVDAGSTVALSSAAARSHDVWVGLDEVLSQAPSLKRVAAEQRPVQRRALGLQSRVADDLFWLGRYVERADGTLRVIRQTLEREISEVHDAGAMRISLAAIRSVLEQGEGGHALNETGAVGSMLMAAWLADICGRTTHPYGLAITFQGIADIVMRCRDRLSEDSWRILKGLDAEGLACLVTEAVIELREGPSAPAQQGTMVVDLIDQIETLLGRLSAFSGLSHENMTRNAGWQFLDIGRRIERARHMCDVLLLLSDDTNSADERADDLQFLLQVADSYITYRSRYRFAPETHLVLDLLLIDETNPRSLCYQLAELCDHIAQLPKSTDDAVRAPDHRLALDLLTRARLADVIALAEPDADGQRGALVTLLTHIKHGLPQLSEVLTRQYFSLADEKPQRLDAPTRG
ncbi:MAG: circularly permuted type 2 ATP-grasp protein [Hyphomicrobiaceae bacterium]